jgi:allophanate hydrolase
MTGARDRVAAAFDAVDAADRPEVWISLADREAAVAQAAALDRGTSGMRAPALAGLTVAVKDNIDVAGLPTTAGCPAFAYEPAGDAAVVAALRHAGATMLGKTNLDQFATGLVGTRSPYGAVRDARRPQFVSGGSSSGSAVAVALGLADLALGTDTAGSGRVPASFQGVLGVKPTQALLSRAGVVPACRSFDCVSLFARELVVAELSLEALWGGVAWPARAPLSAPVRPRIALPGAAALESLSPSAGEAFATAARRLEAGGAELTEIDLQPLLAAGALLYGGAFVAERHAAVGAFITAHPDEVDPTVAEIIGGAGTVSADAYLAAWDRLRALRLEVAAVLHGCDALLLPTVPRQPTIAEVTANPIEVNRELGAFTTFCNLLELCAVALPAGEADSGAFGVTLMARAFHDRALLDLSARFLDGGGTGPSGGRPEAVGGSGAPDARIRPGPPATPLLVVGAHLTGQPLNGQLVAAGGRLIGPVRTAATYRLYRLNTDPAKPGLVRARPGDPVAAATSGELWELPPTGLAALLAGLAPPMAFGPVQLDDGQTVTGFLCEPAALDGALEITAHGGWRAYLETVTAP